MSLVKNQVEDNSMVARSVGRGPLFAGCPVISRKVGQVMTGNAGALARKACVARSNVEFIR
jgi:hypothetical protein